MTTPLNAYVSVVNTLLVNRIPSKTDFHIFEQRTQQAQAFSAKQVLELLSALTQTADFMKVVNTLLNSNKALQDMLNSFKSTLMNSLVNGQVVEPASPALAISQDLSVSQLESLAQMHDNLATQATLDADVAKYHVVRASELRAFAENKHRFKAQSASTQTVLEQFESIGVPQWFINAFLWPEYR